MSNTKEKFFNTIDYKPHDAQWTYHNSPARFKAACCGRRFGKTTMVSRDAELKLLKPNQRLWIVGPTYDLGEKEFRVIFQDFIIDRGFGKDKRVKHRYNKKGGDMVIELPWGTTVEVKSADHPENLVGDSLHHVIMSEAAKHRPDTFERYIRPALADHKGSADFATTPEGQNWFYDIWMLGKDPRAEDWASFRFPSWDNKVLYPGGREDPEILKMEQEMMYEWFEQEIAADFTSFVGKIYKEFEIETHVKPITYNPGWRNFLFFDFGFTNPLAAIDVMISPSEDVYIWREHYKSFLTVEDHIKELKSRDQPDGYHINFATGDAADPEAVAMISKHLVGCFAEPASKENWREGIDLVKRYLKLYEYTDGDFGEPLYRPKLFVDPSCKNTIREFNNYTAAPTNSKINGPPEKPKKIDDHVMDALRYGLYHVFHLGSGGRLSSAMPELVNTSGNTTRSSPVGKKTKERPLVLNVAGSSGFLTSNEEF